MVEAIGATVAVDSTQAAKDRLLLAALPHYAVCADRAGSDGRHWRPGLFQVVPSKAHEQRPLIHRENTKKVRGWKALATLEWAVLSPGPGQISIGKISAICARRR